MLKICLLQVILSFVHGESRLTKIQTVDEYLNICMDGMYQKKEPKPGELYGQCVEWNDRNCCYENTTQELQQAKNWQNFNLNHCQKLSPMCKGHFIQNYCFYECSPNVGPWLVKVNGMESRKERFYKVPLCEQDCDLWWNDCRHDYTCVKNWETDFNWDTGTNVCPVKDSCKKFNEIYTDAKDFCENVFDSSWKVVKKPAPCMKLGFHKVNPNYEVAKQEAQSFFANKSNSVKFTGLIYLCLFYIVIF